MRRRQIPFDQVAPWLVSGASGLYVVARARRLSLARASRDPLLRFLVDQSDLILMLFGSPMVWYLTRPARRNWLGRRARRVGRGLGLSPLHELRQVFTALLIGTALLARKASEGKIADVIMLTMRLYSVVREGTHVLADFEEKLAGHLPGGGVLGCSLGIEPNGPRPPDGC